MLNYFKSNMIFYVFDENSKSVLVFIIILFSTFFIIFRPYFFQKNTKIIKRPL